MRVGYITFCGSIGFNIKNDKYKKEILEEIYDKTGIKIIQKHFNYLQKKHFKKLNEIPHLISLKSNGNPYFLYLTKYNFNNVCIFIDKKIQSGYFLPRMIIVYLQFSEELFTNTLFEGEMIKDNNNNWLFILNDILLYKNNLLNKINIINRLEIIYKILKTNYKNYELAVCDFQIKRYFKYNQLEYMCNEFNNSLNYTNRGIYFTPLYFKFNNILYNFDNSLINNNKKSKNNSNSTFYSNIQHQNIQHQNTQQNIQYNTQKQNTQNQNTQKQNTQKQNTQKQNTQQQNTQQQNTQQQNTQNQNTQQTINKLEKEFYFEKTDMPDVYNMYDLIDNEYIKLKEIPVINNIKTSHYLKNLFNNENIFTKIKINCIQFKKNDKLKWKPIC